MYASSSDGTRSHSSSLIKSRSGPNSHHSFSITFSTARFQSQVILHQHKRHFREFSSSRDHTITKPFQSGYILDTDIFKAWKQLKITLIKHSTGYMYSKAFELTKNMKYQYRLLLFLSPPLSFSLSLTHTHTFFLHVTTITWKTGNTFLNNLNIQIKQNCTSCI